MESNVLDVLLDVLEADYESWRWHGGWIRAMAFWIQVGMRMEEWCKCVEFGDVAMSFFITKHRGGKSADLDASLNQIGCTGRKSLVVGVDVRANRGALLGATGGDLHQ